MNIWDWVLIGILTLSTMLQVYWYAHYLSAPARKMRRDKNSRLSNVNCQLSTPGVSVILCARNEGTNLSDYLHSLLTQDYPEYEVIVVNDGSEDDTQAVIDSFIMHDSRMRTTFVPRNARVRSTKKLALTLGAKAAKYDFLLLSDADCVPESDQWIREMMRGFKSKSGVLTAEYESSADIVLGFGAYFYESGHVNRLVRYDTLFNGLHYLGSALCGHPYMGVGRNLAYRKELFFNTGGFTHQMNNCAGDDDLFVNHTATRENTAVVLSRGSYTFSPAKKSFKEWWQQKRRHLSVSPSYRPETKVRLLIEPLTRGLFYLTLVVAIAYSLYSLPCGEGRGEVLYVALGAFLCRWLMQTLVLNISAGRMGLHGFNPFSILWFDIVLPLVTLWMLIAPKSNNKW